MSGGWCLADLVFCRVLLCCGNGGLHLSAEFLHKLFVNSLNPSGTAERRQFLPGKCPITP
ncbi:hypothetical protein TH8_08950 [Thalassospira profundimaris]|nr:hypothetical protein TH8_08950 [Thalassospira profundimaris]